MKRNGIANLFLGFILGTWFNALIDNLNSKGEILGACLIFLLFAWILVAFLYSEMGD